MPRRIVLLIVSAGTIAVLFVFVVIARWMDWLQYYATPTGANMPALQVGSHCFTTNLRTPVRGNFICFFGPDPITEENSRWIYRLVAVGGDSIEIRDGILLVNGRNADVQYSLMHSYVAAVGEAPDVSSADGAIEIFSTVGGMVLLNGEDGIVRRSIPGARLSLQPKDSADEYIQRQWDRPWNRDYFGPVVVPSNAYFVLGDNRHNALDSRYHGFIPVSNFRGTVLGH